MKSFLFIQVSALEHKCTDIQAELTKDQSSFLPWSETKVNLLNTEMGTSHPFTITQLISTFFCLVNSYVPLNQWHYDFLYLACWDWVSSLKSTYILFFFFLEQYSERLCRQVLLPIFLSAWKHLSHVAHVAHVVGTRNGRGAAASWRCITYLPVYNEVKVLKFRLLLDLSPPYLNQLIILKYSFWMSWTQTVAGKHVLRQTSVKT